MICAPCRKRLHSECRGAGWCDCQHLPPQLSTAHKAVLLTLISLAALVITGGLMVSLSLSWWSIAEIDAVMLACLCVVGVAVVRPRR
jgi:hypothetical protein